MPKIVRVRAINTSARIVKAVYRTKVRSLLHDDLQSPCITTYDVWVDED